MKLFPYQRSAVNILKGILKKSPGAICRADEGLGKTYIAASIAKDYKKILWVGPARSLKSIKKKYPGEVEVVTFISYHGFADISKVQPSEFDLIIWDECHNLRNYTAGWTTRFVKTRGKAKHLFLSATPAVKHELDYVYVMRKCGVFDDFKSMRDVYIKFFDAKPSNFGDFLEKGDLINAEDFLTRLDSVTYDITQEQADKDIPPVNYNIHELDIQWQKPESFEKETETRVLNGAAKIKGAAYLINDIIKKNSIAKSLILMVFHENAKEMYNDCRLPAETILALDSKMVAICFDKMKTQDMHLITTMGLTDCNLDLNECDNIFIVESNYSMPKDRQSIRRCLRVGKRTNLNVHYIVAKEERTLQKAVQSARLFNLKPKDELRIRPSQLSILKDCPGSYWIKGEKIGWVEPYAFFGTQAHTAIERYLNNPKIKISPFVSDNVRYCVQQCRALMQRAESYGVEDKVKLEGTPCHGTVDFWSMEKGTLTILDYKNGNTPVNPQGNMQLRAYALMVCKTHNLSPKRIKLQICQKGQIKTCIENGKVIEYIEEEIKKIIDNVMAAKDDPLSHLNQGKCSFFCSARQLHEAQKGEEEMGKARLPRFTVKGTCIYTSKDDGIFKVGVSLPKEDIPVAKLKKAFSSTQLKTIGKGILDSTNQDYKGNKVLFIGNRQDYVAKNADFNAAEGDEIEAEFTINVKEGDKPFAFFNLKDVTVTKKATTEGTSEEEEDTEALLEADEEAGELDNWM